MSLVWLLLWQLVRSCHGRLLGSPSHASVDLHPANQTDADSLKFLLHKVKAFEGNATSQERFLTWSASSVTPHQFCTKMCQDISDDESHYNVICVRECVGSMDPDDFCVSMCSSGSATCVTGCEAEMHQCMEQAGPPRQRCIYIVAEKYDGK